MKVKGVNPHRKYISDEMKKAIYEAKYKSLIPIYRMGMNVGFNPETGIIHRILHGYPLSEENQRKVSLMARLIDYKGKIFKENENEEQDEEQKNTS